ncbi:MAG: tRNA (adenosine(37)-N6)-dimethylallyltransferase MiaA [Pseudomonadota bacterium]
MRLADHYNAGIISVDSALVYRGMNIGTAKPDNETLSAHPHALIDILSPLESYSVAEFLRDVAVEIARVQSEGRLPLLVGGTMLYFNALTKGLSSLPAADADVREKLEETRRREGLPALYSQLCQLDPESAGRIDANDPQRIVRALEVYALTNRTLSEHYADSKQGGGRYSSCTLSLWTDRAELHKRIERRFGLMCDAGFIEEVESLRRQYPDLDLSYPSMRCVGYRQMWQYLDGECSRKELSDKGIAATRQLAKRQITWMRKMDDLHKLEVGNDLESAAIACVDNFLS